MVHFPGAFDAADGCSISIKYPHGGNKVRKEHNNFENFYSFVITVIIRVDKKFL